ncbi:hypothetical protein ANA_P20034 (plasmid) [Anabaena sp. 90]|uniref:hypothetical protein n=1 Tax=Anabaena sp. 90 TaxID=46234 RepID=UPI00029B75A5|nr:hypothetical protein [Anabaena sp. 90]AFW97288.1 hypothetical protein ANA_P20034 [Anabaena sp. 90]
MVNTQLLLLLFLTFPLLKIEATLAQNTQPRQTPTVTPTKPVNKTPTVTERSRSATPIPKSVTPVNNNVETSTEETTEESAEPLDPEEAEQKANDLDNKISPKNQNPFSKPDIDKLLTQQFNDDMWRIMRGGLPCLETTSSCLEQLQNKSVADSPLLKELDTRIQEATSKIDEARAKNAKTVKLSILTPALQYLLGPTPTAGKPQEGNGLIDNLLGIFNGKTGLINGLINVIGVPLFTASQGTNTEANRNAIPTERFAIAISDLQIKVAELQRARAQLADTIREKVAVALVKFDEGRTDFQIAQVVGARAIDQFKVFELRYIRGNNDTEGYLAKQSELDKVKANTYGSWGKMRRFLRSASLSLFEIKLLVLGVKNAEI